MFLVLMLHILGQGGVLEKSDWFSFNYLASWLFEAFSSCAVDCYAIITGFVCFGMNFRYDRIILLWLQVLFYSVVIMGVFVVCTPIEFSIIRMLEFCFPVITGKYWYFSSYVALFFCMPFLNILGERLGRKQFLKLLATMAILSLVMPRNCFPLISGYCAWWLGILYMVGVYIRKYDLLPSLKPRSCLLLFFVCSLCIWGVKIGCEGLPFHLLGHSKWGGSLYSYKSPFVVMCGIFIFLAFVRMRIKSPVVIACIAWWAPLSFGVYLVHTNPLIFKYVLSDLFTGYASLSPVLFVVAVLGAAVILYLVCSLVDKARLFLFAWIGVNALPGVAVRWARWLAARLHGIAAVVNKRL